MTIDQASRDTRIRPEFIRALESEDFGRLLGDVYVRGVLRSYSSYLGLSPDSVVSAYSRVAGDEPPAPQAPPSGAPVIGALRRRDNHRLLVMVVATVLVLAAAFGVLSSRGSAPPPASLADTPGGPTRPIEAGLTALREVEVTVVIDDAEPRTFTLGDGESRAVTAAKWLRISLARGGVTNVVVSGIDLGYPGDPGRPWTRSFSYETASPSTG